MAAVDVASRNNLPAPTDDLDDLFDYSVPADIFQDVNTDMEVPKRPAQAPLGDADKAQLGGLGIDEEIKVTKKRAPIAKLDETRLLSSAGIPKLKKITKDRLKFKGKGHEYSDVARLLNVYQLWLDDLYPRAKFADGLAMIEKLGHKKQLQIMRKEWINEGRPKEKYDHAETIPEAAGRHQGPPSASDSALANDKLQQSEEILAVDDWSDDEFLGPKVPPTETRKVSTEDTSKESLFIPGDDADDGAPPEDDLDALLAEGDFTAQAAPFTSQNKSVIGGKEHANFDDEMEAMAGLDDMW